MTTYTYIHSFMTLSQRFDPYHDTCVTRLVWRRRVPWGLVVLAREYPCGPEVTAAAAAVATFLRLLTCAEKRKKTDNPRGRDGRTARRHHTGILTCRD